LFAGLGEEDAYPALELKVAERAVQDPNTAGDRPLGAPPGQA